MTTLIVAALMSTLNANAAEPLFDVEPAFADAAHIRVANLSPDALLDTYVDGHLVSEDLDFTQMDRGIRVIPGEHTVTFVDALTDEVVLEGNLAFRPESTSMLIAYDRIASLDAARIRPRRDLPLRDDQTMFQVLHGADMMGPMGIVELTDDNDWRTLRGLRFGEQSGFRHANGEWRLGVDIDGDREPEYTFDIPPTDMYTQVTVVPVTDGNGDFYLQVYTDTADLLEINPN